MMTIQAFQHEDDQGRKFFLKSWQNGRSVHPYSLILSVMCLRHFSKLINKLSIWVRTVDNCHIAHMFSLLSSTVHWRTFLSHVRSTVPTRSLHIKWRFIRIFISLIRGLRTEDITHFSWRVKTYNSVMLQLARHIEYQIFLRKWIILTHVIKMDLLSFLNSTLSKYV